MQTVSNGALPDVYKRQDLKYFYPTNTLVTGYDIIGFWVSRMIFSGLAYTGKAPVSYTHLDVYKRQVPQALIQCQQDDFRRGCFH